MHLANWGGRNIGNAALIYGLEHLIGEKTAGPVAVAYAIRWLELGDRVERPAFEIWLAESPTGPGRSPAGGDRSAPTAAAASASAIVD